MTAVLFIQLLLNLANPTEICLALEQSSKKVYSRATTKSIPLFQPEQGFCHNNGSECGQKKDWYTNKKMVVVPICFEKQMLLSRVCGYCIVLTYIKAMSLCLFCLFERCYQCKFSGTFKGRQTILEPCRNSKYFVRRLL